MPIPLNFSLSLVAEGNESTNAVVHTYICEYTECDYV